MSDKYWEWCPDSDTQPRDYRLDDYGFTGVCHVEIQQFFAVLTFRLSNVPDALRQDVAYRVYLRYVKESRAHVPRDIAVRLMPVCADVQEEAVDMIIDGIEQINKYFFSVMKMNEYHDDITHLMEVGMGTLDYFIGYLVHLREDLGRDTDQRIRELKFKRSYMLSMQMHLYN